LSEDEKKRKKPLKGTGGSLAGSAIAKNENDEEKHFPSQIVTSDITTCPVCKQSFPSSSYSKHSPCFD
jgi:hypothetical protein